MGAKKNTSRTLCVREARGSSVSRTENGKHAKARRHSMLSKFSGGGGLDLGLDMTGRYDHLACVELDTAACRTLTANRDAGLLGTPDLEVVEADISKMDVGRLLSELGLRPGELDLLAGGPPCQAFSTAGKQLGVADPRGQLIWDWVRLVREARPRVFLMENVKGLLSVPLEPGMPKGSLFESLLGKLCSAGYRVDWFLADAADYGVPQHRERVILIGNRAGLAATLPEPTHGPGRLPYEKFRDAVARLDESDPVLMDFSPRQKRFLSFVRAGSNWVDVPLDVRKEVFGPTGRPKSGSESGRYRRLAWDEPAPTIITRPNQTRTCYCHPDHTRALTLRECARIQTFPDEWVFCGNKEQKYRQVGNAVPVGLAEVLGHAVADLLDRIHAEGGCRDRDGNPAGRKKAKAA